MKRTKEEDKDESTSAISNLNSSTGSNSNDATATGGTVSAASAVRTTGRVKKPKQVYDPSDNYISRGPRNSTTANTNVQASLLPAPAPVAPVPVAPPVVLPVSKNKKEVVAASAPQCADPRPALRHYDMCSKCGIMELKRGSGHKSNYLACKSCQSKWHFSCLPISFEVLAVARKKYKCVACRCCRICGTKGKDLAICSVCVYSFHRNCHDPPLNGSDLSECQWKCQDCELSSNNNNNHSASEQTGRKSYPGRKKRAQSDPAGQEKSPPAKQAKTAQESKEQSKTEVTVAATVVSEPDIKYDASKEKEKEELKLKKDEIKSEENRLSTDEIEEPKEAVIAEEIIKKPKEELMLEEDLPEKFDEDLPENVDEKGPEIKLEEGCQQEKPNEVSSMALQSMDQQPLEEAVVPIDSNEEEIVLVSVGASTQPKTNSKRIMGEKLAPVRTWTVDQVVTYISRFYPDEAKEFYSQDVDGASLLLLTREDVIKGFGFKLGPALRIFQVVLSLQSRTNNVALGWSST